jgi:hypothetical protein
MLPDSEERQDDARPSAAEIERRKQVRSGLPVERAVNEPGGRPAPANAPEGAEKKE